MNTEQERMKILELRVAELEHFIIGIQDEFTERNDHITKQFLTDVIQRTVRREFSIAISATLDCSEY